jgi:UPF0755 protein
MPPTPYDTEGSAGWDAYRSEHDAYDSQSSLPGLPVAAGGAPARSDPFHWHPPEVPAGDDPASGEMPGTAVWDSGQLGGRPGQDFPIGQNGGPAAGRTPFDENRQRGEPGWDARRGPQRPDGRDLEGAGQYPGEQYPGDESSGPGRRGDLNGRSGGRGPGSGPPEVADHPDWAGDDQHPGFFQGFGNDEGVDPPRRRRGRLAAPLIALIVLLVIVVAAGGGLLYIYQARHANYSGPGTGEVTVVVKPGNTATSLAPEFRKLGIIKATEPFIDAAKASPRAADLTPGTYKLHHHMNAALAWALLVSGKSVVQTTASIPDGERATEIIAQLAKASGKPLSQFKAALADTKALGLPSFANGSPEGYLFPDTYPFQPGTTPLKMVQTMVQHFNQEATALDLAAKAKQAQFTEGQIITEASILEAEVGPADYAKVARVIDNRLNARMPLQVDSTVLYALKITGFSLTEKQLHFKSPYNTFLHTGLPPGPIDSPGAKAIYAALHPAKGNWTYFVTIDPKTGRTGFTNSYSQFLIWSKESAKNIKDGT